MACLNAIRWPLPRMSLLGLLLFIGAATAFTGLLLGPVLVPWAPVAPWWGMVSWIGAGTIALAVVARLIRHMRRAR